MNDWDKILEDFAHKCGDGGPDMTNPRHLALLRESLLKFGWKEFATNEFIGNLRETKDKSDDSWWTKKTPAQQAQYIKDHPGSEKAKTAKDKLSTTSKQKQDKKDKKPTDTEKKSLGGSSKQQEQKTRIDREVKEDLDFIVENAGEVRTQGGAGSDTPTRQQVADLQTFTEKRMEQDARRKEAEEKGEPFDEEPYVHPDVVQREIDDKTLDESMDYLKEKLGGEEFDNLVRFLSKGGAVHAHLTKVTKLKRGEPGLDPESPGYKRVREIIRLYLKNDGKCAVSGVPMKLSECDPDHRIPYSTAVAEAERNGTTVQEEQRKLDDFKSNLDLMLGPINKFKSSLVDDKLLNATRKRLAMSKEAEEVKELETLYKNQRTQALNKHYRKKFSLGDLSSLTEKNINEADDDERNAMMKAWNYMHPSKKEMREQIEGKKSAGLKGDPDYYKKLKKLWKAQGVDLPDNPEDVEFEKPPFSKWMNRYGFGDSGEKRERSNRLSPGKERIYMREHFEKQGQNVPTIDEQNEIDEVVDDAREEIRKDTTLKQIGVEKIKLKDPNLSDRQKQNVQRKIDKLKKSLE
jgi:hypothetical protein